MYLRRPYPLAAMMVWTVFTFPVLAQTPTTKPADPIDTKLDSRISIKLTGLTAERAVIKVQEEQQLNLIVDWEGLKATGLLHWRLLDGELTNVTTREAIHVILMEGGCTEIPPIVRDGNLLRVSVAPVVETRVFPVGKTLDRLLKELTVSPTGGVTVPPGPSDAADRLVHTIQDHINADTWRENGGTVGSMSILGRRAIVTQTPAALEKIEKLLRELEKDDAK